jgi:hypothetical protein
MNKRDAVPASADPGVGVDEFNSLVGQVPDGIINGGDRKGDVVEPFAVLR